MRFVLRVTAIYSVHMNETHVTAKAKWTKRKQNNAKHTEVI